MNNPPPTYQQLLAEQYEENARDMLVYQESDYQDVEVEVDPHNSHHDVGVELTDPHEFNRFGGNRNTDHIIIKPKEFDDKGKSSVRYNKDVQNNIFNIDTRFRSYAVPGIPQQPSTLTQNSTASSQNYISSITADITSLTSNYVFHIERLVRNIISVSLTSFELPNRFFNLVDVRNNYYIYVKQGTYNDTTPYTKVPVYITDVNLSSTTFSQTIGPKGQNGFYYSNTSIIPALNYALQQAGFIELSLSNKEGYCHVTNSSTVNTYVFNFTPEAPPSGVIINTQIYETLGRMLGFTNFVYEIAPINSVRSNECVSTADYGCGQIVISKNISFVSAEDPIDMNADTYIYLTLSDWNNVQHETADNSFFTVFAKIPVTVDKGKLIYDTNVSNTTTKIYYFTQPTNIQQFQISLLDKTGQLLLMPNVDWSMTLELEEVLSQSLYEKMREL